MDRVSPHILIALLVAAAGCNKADSFQRVSGSVSFQGQPLNQGRIEFLPLDRQGTAQGTLIADGAYAIPAEKGLLPGKYQVMVFSSDHVHTPPSGPIGSSPTDPPPKERIAAKYNLKSALSAEVKSGVPNVFDFQVD